MKKLLIIVVIILVLIVGGVYYKNKTKTAATSGSTDSEALTTIDEQALDTSASNIDISNDSSFSDTALDDLG